MRTEVSPQARSAVLFWICALSTSGCGESADVGSAIFATQLAVSFDYACALLTDKTVACWGDGSLGQLGDGQSGEHVATHAASVPGLSGAIQIDVGAATSCALLQDGTVWCWGSGNYGQLGNDTAADGAFETTPVQVVGLTDIKRITVGLFSVCAVHESGEVSCWGENAFNSFPMPSGPCGPYEVSSGDGSYVTDWPCEPVPALLPDIDDAVDAGAGFNYGCALHKSGTVSCWGDAASVGRGVGGPSDPTVEIVPSGLVTGLSDAVALRVGNGLTCALRSQKTVACWGAQLGFREPVEMPWAADAVTVGKYQPIGAALLPDGTARAWGQVSALGDGTLFTTAPIELGIPSNTVELALDGRSACAREQSGTVLCWGPNDTTLGVVDR